jgi:hypothetical protein
MLKRNFGGHQPPFLNADFTSQTGKNNSGKTSHLRMKTYSKRLPDARSDLQ